MHIQDPDKAAGSGLFRNADNADGRRAQWLGVLTYPTVDPVRIQSSIGDIRNSVTGMVRMVRERRRTERDRTAGKMDGFEAGRPGASAVPGASIKSVSKECGCHDSRVSITFQGPRFSSTGATGLEAVGEDAVRCRRAGYVGDVHDR